MSRLVGDLASYLKTVFVESYRLFFTVFDVLGLVLFLYPNLAYNLTKDINTVRAFGGITCIISFLLAHFTVYRALIQRISELEIFEADIRLKVMNNPSLSHPHSTGHNLFSDIQINDKGFDKQGVPGWASLWVLLEAENVGGEGGELEFVIDIKKSKIPPLFALDTNSKVIIDAPSRRVEARRRVERHINLGIRIADREPVVFAQTLRSLRNYTIALNYRTERIGGLSEWRPLIIEGDFQEFREKILEYWEGFGFSDLAKLVK